MNSLESLVHLKAILEADRAIDRVDINTEEESLNIHYQDTVIPIYTEGWRELFILKVIADMFIEKGEIR